MFFWIIIKLIHIPLEITCVQTIAENQFEFLGKIVSMLEKDWNIGNIEGGKERILSPNSQIIPLIKNNTVDTFISILIILFSILQILLF